MAVITSFHEKSDATRWVHTLRLPGACAAGSAISWSVAQS